MTAPDQTTPPAPALEWLATNAARIFAGRPDMTTAAALGAAQELWRKAAALAGAAPDAWKLAFQPGNGFERERVRLATLGLSIDAAGRRTPEDVALDLQPPGSKKKGRAAVADLRKLAAVALEEFTETVEAVAAFSRDRGKEIRPSAFPPLKAALEELAHGLPCTVAPSTARVLFNTRARMIRAAKSEAGREGGRPKERPKRRK
jgi:hypothetical protein